MEITLEENPINKKKIVREVLIDLPEWFGIDEALNEYVQNSSKYLLWVAKKGTDVLGFISLKETSPKVGEIYCMGVKKDSHHNRLGTQLFRELEQYAKGIYDFIQVKTIEQGRYEQYDCTIQFYKSIGFIEFEVFPTLWDEWNPCLIMIKAITS